MKIRKYIGIIPLGVALAALPVQADLAHRYSFTTDASDSVGTANGTLRGTATVDAGSLVLDGSDGCYLDLGGNILSSMSSDVTFEVWTTWNGTSSTWQQLLCFGSNSGGQGSSGTGTTYFGIMPCNGGSGVVRFTITTNSNSGEKPILNAPSALTTGQPSQVAVVYSPSTSSARLYVNGELAAYSSVATTPLSAMNDYNDYVGRSQWNDPYFNGSIDELRIYNSALSSAQIQADYIAGADLLTGTPGTLSSIAMTTGGTQLYGAIIDTPTVMATYDSLTSPVNLVGAPGLTFSSDNTNVISIDAKGVIHAVGTGTANLIASYQGKTTSATINVQLETVQLMHRYSFNDDFSSAVATDSVGGANGDLIGASLDGLGNVLLAGDGGYVNLPNGIISSLTNATFEMWTTWNGGAAWQRLFDFGTSSQGEDQQGTGTKYIYLTPKCYNGYIRFGATTGSEQDADASSALTVGTEVNVTVAYNASQQYAKVYVDGVLVASNTITVKLSDIPDVNNWLGRSQFNDTALNASIDEFRIYEGVKSDFEIAVDVASGVDKISSDAGALQSISMTGLSTSVVVGSVLTPPTVAGTYANLTKTINLSAMPGLTFSSDNTKVISVDASGNIRAVGAGSANVSATYNGKQSPATTVTVTSLPNALVHRYSFESNAVDSVGGKNGTLLGTAFVDNGALVLDGTDGNYVDLGGGVLSNLTGDVTFELWTTWYGSGACWQSVIDFGSNTSGRGGSGTGTTYFGLFPANGSSAVARFCATTNSGGAENPILNAPSAIPTGEPTHVAIVFNTTANKSYLYIDGTMVASGAAPIPLGAFADNNDYIGRSQWSGDPYYNGTIDEIRIYNSALSGAQIAADYQAGTSTLNPSFGSLQSLTMTVDSTVFIGGIIPTPTVIAKYSSITNSVNLAGNTDLTFTTSDSSIISIDSTGVIHAVGIGSATLTASYQGKTISKLVTVKAESVQLAHRYSFDGDASSSIATDSVGDANGELIGCVLDGAGQVVLAGDGGYVNLPNGIISSLTNMTIEAWFTWNGGDAWQRLYDFGSSTSGEDVSDGGTIYTCMTPMNGSVYCLGFRDGTEVDLTGSAALPQNTEVCASAVYNISQQWVKMYQNGILVASNKITFKLSDIPDVNNWIGRSQFKDPYLNASVNEFRIYSGAKSDEDILVDTVAGSSKLTTNATLQSIALSATSTDVNVHGFDVPLNVKAQYTSVSDVDVTSQLDITYAINDTNVAILNGTSLRPVSVGSVTITATYKDKSSSLTFNVFDTNAPIALLHRYSFNEAVGSTTVKDSVGGEDGVLKGTYTLTGSQLIVPGGAPNGNGTINTNAGYVDLPNGMISSLPNKATFEIWATWNGGNAWQPMISFGCSKEGEDLQGTGTNYLLVTPYSGNNTLRAVFKCNDTDGESPSLNSTTLPTGVESYIVVTYDSDLGIARLYRNGVRVDTKTVINPLSALNDINNWLGRAQWGDYYFNGSYNELRIWSGVMTDKDVATSLTSGADTLPGQSSSSVTITITYVGGNVTLTWPSTATDYVLESAPSIGNGATWTTVTVPAGKTSVTLPATGTQFYRLRK